MSPSLMIKNDYMETNNVDNVSNEHDSNVGLPVSVKGEPSAVTSEVLEHISTSCHSESSGGEELSSQKVPPLRIKFASGTSGDESSSMTSSSTSAGVAGSGFTVHSTNISENNIASDELDRSDRCDVKPRVSVNGLMNVNSKSDSNEAVVVVDSHRHRSGRTLRSHTAAQREKEEKERHTDDTTPIKKRKLRSRSDAATSQENNSQHSRSGINVVGITTGHANNSPVTTHSGSASSSNMLSSSNSVVNMDVVEDTHSSSTATTSQSEVHLTMEQSGRHGDQSDCDMGYLFCPAAPGDEDRKDIELLKFQNPYEKAAELSKSLRELVDNLVKVHPKAPCGYQDYLLVTRNYLLANQLSLATYVKRSPPAHLEATFVELFNEQEEERYAQALKHQSEREHLQLGAEQAVLRAQTRGALAVANQSKPYSFCSILSYNDLTYIPPVGKLENREEENVRDRFTPRTFIGWLQDIIDTFQNEKVSTQNVCFI
ncbi:Ankyrin repeat domain-containing protein 12 [Schistosoma japonicum]|nr:Ankyrin repeat domain-containing protein 12 [Schistosoma japonicum]KAH8878406.1 Ankyrin repeat domain-containing protein 12 [Schistosoma japonicum]